MFIIPDGIIPAPRPLRVLVSIIHRATLRKYPLLLPLQHQPARANNVQDTHWELNSVATTDGFGVTEPGSSGSPLYEPSGLIVGHLTGGVSQCGGPEGPDLYGKIAFDWTSNGVTPDRQLQPWLDPDNTVRPPCKA